MTIDKPYIVIKQPSGQNHKNKPFVWWKPKSEIHMIHVDVILGKPLLYGSSF